MQYSPDALADAYHSDANVNSRMAERRLNTPPDQRSMRVVTAEHVAVSPITVDKLHSAAS